MPFGDAHREGREEVVLAEQAVDLRNHVFAGATRAGLGELRVQLLCKGADFSEVTLGALALLEEALWIEVRQYADGDTLERCLLVVGRSRAVTWCTSVRRGERLKCR